jgi:hypothetical protein
LGVFKVCCLHAVFYKRFSRAEQSAEVTGQIEQDIQVCLCYLEAHGRLTPYTRAIYEVAKKFVMDEKIAIMEISDEAQAQAEEFEGLIPLKAVAVVGENGEDDGGMGEEARHLNNLLKVYDSVSR